MKWTLKIAGKRYTFSKSLKIGRSTGDVRLPDAKKLSRQHCVIFEKEGSLYLQDYETTNPSSVNGKELSPNKPVKISSGDNIKIGEFTVGVRAQESHLALYVNFALYSVFVFWTLYQIGHLIDFRFSAQNPWMLFGVSFVSLWITAGALLTVLYFALKATKESWQKAAVSAVLLLALDSSLGVVANQLSSNLNLSFVKKAGAIGYYCGEKNYDHKKCTASVNTCGEACLEFYSDLEIKKMRERVLTKGRAVSSQ